MAVDGEPPAVVQRVTAAALVGAVAFAWHLQQQWSPELGYNFVYYQSFLWPPTKKSAPVLAAIVAFFAVLVQRTFLVTGQTAESKRIREEKRRLLLAQMSQALRWNYDEANEEEEGEKKDDEGKDGEKKEKKKDEKKKRPPTVQELYVMVFDDIEERHVTEYDIPANEEPFMSTLALFKERLVADFKEYVLFTNLARKEAAGENIAILDHGLDNEDMKRVPEFADGTKLTELLELWHKKMKKAFGKDILPKQVLKDAEQCKTDLAREQRKGVMQLWPALRSVLPTYMLSLCLMAFDGSNGTVVYHTMKTLLDEVGSGKMTMDELRALTLQCYIQFGFCVFAHLTAWAFCHKCTADFRLKVRNKIMENMVRQDMKFFDFYPSGILQERLNSDAEQLSSKMFHLPLRLVESACRLGSCVYVMVMLEPELFYVIAMPVPIVAVSCHFIFKFMRKMGQRQRKIGEHVAANTMEVLKEIRTVRDFTMETEEARKFAASSAYRAEIEKYANGVHHVILIPPLCLMFEGMRFLCTYLGGHYVTAGKMTVGQAVMAAGLAGDMTHIIRGFFDLIPELIQTFQPLGRVCEMLSATPLIEPHPNSPPKLKPDKYRGAITFEKVNFTFPSEPLKQVLFDLSWSVNPGETIGFVGGTGCGKSTSFYLLQRWYAPQSGTITLDGRNIAEYDVHHLRRHMAIVAQTTCLFSTTIRENITYGLPLEIRETITNDEIEQAMRKANAWKFVNEFPRKLETYAGERGVKLSGGQRQRLAIARAIIRNPTIVLLDEATSALDSKAEVVVQEALDKMIAEREGGSTMVTAHRLSTLRGCNRIIVMDKGHIQESGSHDELMAIEVTKNEDGTMKTGWYRDLYETQHGKQADVEGLKKEVERLSKQLEELQEERNEERRETIRRLKLGLSRSLGKVRRLPGVSEDIEPIQLVRHTSETGTDATNQANYLEAPALNRNKTYA